MANPKCMSMRWLRSVMVPLTAGISSKLACARHWKWCWWNLREIWRAQLIRRLGLHCCGYELRYLLVTCAFEEISAPGMQILWRFSTIVWSASDENKRSRKVNEMPNKPRTRILVDAGDP